MKPILRQIANLWTLIGCPSTRQEWTLDEKLQAIREAGFDGVCWAPSDELTKGAERHGLIFVGGMAPSNFEELALQLGGLKGSGAVQVNVQLGTDAMLTGEALPLCIALMEQARSFGLQPVVETHRGTCTETPEKMYALADAYEEVTGERLPIAWDFSHFAVVKHLVPENFVGRLLVRHDLIRHAQHFHLRPFNGHHAQVPITNGRGELTREVIEWIPFAEATLGCWLETNGESGREIFVCPELGPVEGGYALSTFPNSWEEAKVLRGVIDQIWKRLTA